MPMGVCKLKQMRNIQQHFSIRKLTVGAASVLIGISFLATTNTNQVHADTLNDSTQTVQTETKQSAASENTKTVQESSAQNVKTDNTESVAQSADAQTAKPADASNENATKQENKSVDDPTALTQKSDANTKVDAAVSNTETDEANDQSSSVQNTELKQSTQNTDKSQLEASQSQTDEQKQAPVETTVLIIKPGTEKDAQNLAESKVEKSDPAENNKLSATMQDGTTISINRGQVGAVDDTSNLVIHVIYHNVKQGDKYILTIPYGVSYRLINPDGQKLQTFGTTTSANTGKGYTITNDFNRELTAGNIVSQTFELGMWNNYRLQPVNITEIGNMLKTITLDKYVDNKKTDSVDVSFTQVVAPEMAPTFKRVVPNTDISAIYPNTDYTYELDLNETDGINKGISYSSGQANNVVNSGTTITVPVPPDFVLNEDRTAKANNFDRQGDTTTIKQIGGKGGDIIITAPKGSGRQNWERTSGYRFVGHYETNETGVTSATRKITIEQTVTRYDGSTYTIKKTLDQPWSENVGTMDANQMSAIQIGITGYSNSGELSQGMDPTRPINIFTFENDNAFDIDHPDLTLSFDHQLQINRITMPQSVANSSDTTTYQYKAVLSDGRTINGTLHSSDELKTDNGVYIRTVVLTPNILRAGATAVWGPERIAAYGSLSDTAKAGDSIITEMGAQYKMNVNGQEVVSTVKPNAICMQTVKEEVATFGTFTWQTKSSARSQDAGYLSLVQSEATLNANAHLVEEPILYYVLPKNTTFNEQIGVTNINGAPNGAKVKPAISTFWVDGREVVKIDYTGTGIKVDTYGSANTQIHLDNSPLAEPGAYNWTVYAESKHMKLGNSLATSTSDFNPAFTEGKTDNVYALGGGPWGIGTATETGITSGAIGNKDGIPVTKGTSDDKGSKDMAFDFRVINHNQELDNATAVIDLNDHNEGAFNFQVTGPVTITEQDPNDRTQVLYSTSIFTKPAETVGAQPDLTNFKTADQMTANDWKNVKAIAFKLGNLGDDTSSSIFRIHGRDENLTTDAGKSYSYSTYLFGNEVSPSYANSLANPSITISGKSTIKYQLHYTDANGQEHTVALDGMNTTYNDGQDKMPSKAQVEDAFKNYADNNNVIPENYKFDANNQDAVSLINGGITWQTNDPNNTIGFGDTIQYFADGDTVQFNLVHETVNIDADHPAGKYTKKALQKSATRTINYVDGNGNKIAEPTTTTVVFNASGVLDEVTGHLVNLNSDGSIKDQNGKLNWTYAVYGGSTQAGDSYTFSQVPISHTLEHNNDIYQFVSVDPAAKQNGNNVAEETINASNAQDENINVVYNLLTYSEGEKVSKTVNRNINYLDDEDHTKGVAPSVSQKATITRYAIVNNVDCSIIGYGTVSADGKSYKLNGYDVDNGWIQVTSPDLSGQGYEAASQAQVEAENVDDTTTDKTINIYYKHHLLKIDKNTKDKHGVTDDQLGKDVTETVHFVYANGTKAHDDAVQTRHYTRSVTVDAVNDNIVPNGRYTTNWALAEGQNGNYDAVSVPVTTGYFADATSVPSQEVTQESIEKTVTYKELGHVIAVDKDDNVIVGADSPQFANNPSDPTKSVAVNAPKVTNYHLANGQSETVQPNSDPSQDVKVIYDKDQGSVKVVFHDDTTDQDLTGVGYDSGNADFDTPITYITEQDLDNLGKKGYVYVSTDGVIPDKITANQNTTIIVHMRHGVVEITGKTPIDQVPANTVEAAQPDKLTKEVTLTVNYFNNDGTPFTGTIPANAHQTITFNGTAYVDAVTGQIVNAKQENGQLVIDEDNTKTPAVIWTSDKTSFDKVISPAENGYHVISVSDHKDGNDVGVIDGINFDSVNIEVTVTYAPDPKSEPEPQPEPQPEPDNKPDDNKPTPTPDNKPDNTIVPKGETDNGENKPNEVKRADKKAHKSVEKGNGAVVKGADKPTKSNAKQPGTKQGHIDDNSTSKVTKSPRKAAQAKTESKSINRKAALPQTGEKTTSLVWLGLGLASLATIIDLAGDRKRR